MCVKMWWKSKKTKREKERKGRKERYEVSFIEIENFGWNVDFGKMRNLRWLIKI